MTKLASANGFQLRLASRGIHSVLRTEKACANAFSMVDTGMCEKVNRRKGRQGRKGSRQGSSSPKPRKEEAS